MCKTFQPLQPPTSSSPLASSTELPSLGRFKSSTATKKWPSTMSYTLEFTPSLKAERWEMTMNRGKGNLRKVSHVSKSLVWIITLVSLIGRDVMVSLTSHDVMVSLTSRDIMVSLTSRDVMVSLTSRDVMGLNKLWKGERLWCWSVANPNYAKETLEKLIYFHYCCFLNFWCQSCEILPNLVTPLLGDKRSLNTIPAVVV